ncbi:MAG: anti-sigma factor [Burkholderiales bacterium]|nr:anti-sigma factor [Burkholderiales bacterium]
MNPLPVSDADIHAYVDSQLAPKRMPAVEDALARDPALAARVTELRQQNASLRDAFDPWLDEALPERLVAGAAAPRANRQWMPSWVGMALAAAACLVVGVGLGWFGREISLENDGTPITFTRQAALVHALYASDANRPVEIWAAEEQRLVRWLSRRLGFQVRAPDLNSLGFALVGGRLVAGNENPTALFVYENADKRRLTLQVRKPVNVGHETAFRYAVEDGVGVYYWVEENATYALSGNLDRGQLLAIGRVVYGQLATLEAAPASTAPAATPAPKAPDAMPVPARPPTTAPVQKLS